MVSTVGTKMMGNIENTNPKTISASQELHQPGSHTSKKRKRCQPGSHMSIRKERAQLSSLLLCMLISECKNHASLFHIDSKVTYSYEYT